MIFKNRNHSWSLVVTRGHSWSLVVIRGHSWSFVVTRGHSWSLVVTRGHSCVLLDKIPVARVDEIDQNATAHWGNLLTPTVTSDAQLSWYLQCAPGLSNHNKVNSLNCLLFAIRSSNNKSYKAKNSRPKFKFILLLLRNDSAEQG
jgi:hypothetical protein